MLTRYLFAVANLVVEHCYSIRQWRSSTSFVDRGKAEGVRRGREWEGKGKGTQMCVHNSSYDYFSKKNFEPRPKGYQNLKKGYGVSIGGLEHNITLKRSQLYVKAIDR